MIWSTFSGIGGLDLGLEMAGFPAPSLVCEWEPWNRALLAQHYPDAIQHTDIKTLEAHHGPPPFLITGGFPCQDISCAGARAGLAGEKSGLWWELARVIAATRPQFVVLENVAAIVSDSQPVVPPRAKWLGDTPAEPFLGAFGAVLWTLAALGYDATWDCVPAGALGAPHRRDRWFLVAYSTIVRSQHGKRSKPSSPKRPRPDTSSPQVANPSSSRLEGHHADNKRGCPQRAQPPTSDIWRRALNTARAQSPWAYQPRVGGAADGLPDGVDRPGQPWEQGQPRTKPHQAYWKQRLKGLGNAVVPVAGMVPGLVVRELMARLQR